MQSVPTINYYQEHTKKFSDGREEAEKTCNEEPQRFLVRIEGILRAVGVHIRAAGLRHRMMATLMTSPLRGNA